MFYLYIYIYIGVRSGTRATTAFIRSCTVRGCPVHQEEEERERERERNTFSREVGHVDREVFESRGCLAKAVVVVDSGILWSRAWPEQARVAFDKIRNNTYFRAKLRPLADALSAIFRPRHAI